jgi:1-acyl-sn-glycerol-3-phosphate acyltransferase
MSRWGKGRVSEDIWWTIGYWTVGLICRLLFRIRAYGLRRLPADGAAIVASNHVSVLDPVILGIAATRRGRTVRFLAAAEVFHKPLVGLGLRLIRQIPIKRGAGDYAALEEAAEVIRSGALAGIYPEGGVNPGDPAVLQRGRKGAARLALTAGAPLVPVAVWGTQVRWPRTGLTWGPPLRPRIAVVFGDPIPVSGDVRDPNTVRDLTDRLMAAIEVCLAEAKRRAPNA